MTVQTMKHCSQLRLQVLLDSQHNAKSGFSLTGAVPRHFHWRAQHFTAQVSFRVLVCISCLARLKPPSRAEIAAKIYLQSNSITMLCGSLDGSGSLKCDGYTAEKILEKEMTNYSSSCLGMLAGYSSGAAKSGALLSNQNHHQPGYTHMHA